jgi:hypothetical protein
MWISGRRAVRPDRDYYRNVRRIRLRRSISPARKNSLIGTVAAALMTVIALGVWLLLKR